MKKRKLLFTMLALSLGCLSGGSGAMAQNGWEVLYTQTQTTSDDWRPLYGFSCFHASFGAARAKANLFALCRVATKLDRRSREVGLLFCPRRTTAAGTDTRNNYFPNLIF